MPPQAIFFYFISYLACGPVFGTHYSLIHYDFELDNVFYDYATKSCSVIDFDDAMYHWYMMDIEQTLDSLKSEIAEQEFHQKKAAFLKGYRTQFSLDDNLLAMMPLFRRFANLYGYTRIVRSLQEQWDNEPEWLVSLREKLAHALRQRSKYFGRTISPDT